MNNEIWTQQRRTEARRSAAKYVGTPHHSRMDLPGEGVDCVHFVSAILRDAGIIPPVQLPAYDDRIGRLRRHNIIEDILRDHLHCEPATEPEFGDIVICKCGPTTNHVGIVIGDDMWHVPGKGRVGPEALVNWRDRIQTFLRITATGLRSDPAILTARGILARPSPVE